MQVVDWDLAAFAFDSVLVGYLDFVDRVFAEAVVEFRVSIYKMRLTMLQTYLNPFRQASLPLVHACFWFFDRGAGNLDIL